MVVLILHVLRNLHTIIHRGCTNLHFYQQCTRVPFSPHPPQHLLCVVFLIIEILTEVSKYLTVALICISNLYLYLSCICSSLMIGEVECLFTCQLLSSLKKCLSRFSTHFLNLIVWFLILGYTIWIVTPY